MEPPGRIELPLAAYRTATHRSVGGVVTSRGIEPRSLGLQPSAMTTLARWSLGGADGGSRTRACALRGRRASGNTSSTWSRLEDSNPDSPVIGRTSCLLDEAWVGPVGWSRTSMVPLKRRGHSRSATTGYGGMKLGCRAGIRTRILPVNSRTCCRCHHPTIEDEMKMAARRGLEPRSAASEAAVLPLDDLAMVGSGGLEPPRTCARGRWATDYPTTRGLSWGERPESNRLERVSRTRGAPFAFTHHRTGRR
jgi:hypothetical protein